jgi:UDP-N-acetylmuramate dehydrogenase
VLAGTRLLDFIRQAVAAGLAGMESMAGIPGNVGGALRMNAGAFGQEIEAVTESVHGFRPDGTPFSARRSEIDFGYRCAPALEDVVITSTVLRFEPGDPSALRARLEEILARRAAKQPLEYPSCGSVFKRPPGHYAGALIEQAGLKGERIGGAMVSSKHAGFIINIDDATADDVFRLIRKVQARVYETFQVELEREVKLIGEFRL